jgi:hypothetical protein
MTKGTDMDRLTQYELEALNLKSRLEDEGKAKVEVAAAYYTLLLKQAKEMPTEEIGDECAQS